MRLFRSLTLLLGLFAPLAMADSLYQVEVIFFRQAGEVIPASQPAPEDWAAGSQPLAAGSERGTALNAEAEKLVPANGYQVLLHQAWAQSIGPAPVKLALTAGNTIYGHYPIEGTLTFSQDQLVDLQASLWINQIDSDGVVTGSELLRQSTRLQPGKLTYIDHGSLGLLIRLSPL